ncbi:MAG TPA: hypothetical protein VFC78_01555 [Tepidisphaeraceae bacterium]|nr:hypothetical protein [Tepidisphaeraceae bacterium]
MKHVTIHLLSLATMLLAGCCNCPKPSEPVNVATWPMSRVVERINANNRKIPSLWATHNYEADVVDEKHHSHHVSGAGKLLYMPSNSMRLTGDAVVGTVFDIGSNANTYWLKLGAEAGDTMWWGKWSDFANINPDHMGIPIRPDMVLDVLGVSTIDTNFNVLPAPIMRFDNKADSYVFTWVGKLPDRWVGVREIWYKRETLRPWLVRVYDMNGRVVMRGELSRYRQVLVPDQPKTQWPWMPGNYVLSFPDSGSRMVFTLDDARLYLITEAGRKVPNPKTFRMPPPGAAGVDHVIQIGGQAGE